MGTVEKIAFPYGLPPADAGPKRAVFFGTDFYNLPKGSNQELFIERTNEMLSYMRRHLPGCVFIYQPHPNETDEHTFLDLTDFELGEKAVAEVLLYEYASDIIFVLSACSGASLSAYEMGFNAAVCIDLLHGVLPEEAIVGYRSYFGGAPENFFLRSFEGTLPAREPISKEFEALAISRLKKSIGSAKKLWVLTSGSPFAVQAALVLKYAREQKPGLEAGILKVGGRRWGVNATLSELEEGFQETIHISDGRVLYSARVERLFAAAIAAFRIWRLPIRKGDVVVSFCYMMFEENCVVSYHKRKARMIGLIENRWYHFTFVDGGKDLPESGFRASWGALAFAWFLEPLLGLYRTIMKEYRDGRVINLMRYRAPLESVFDTAFVLMPDAGSVMSKQARG